MFGAMVLIGVVFLGALAWGLRALLARPPRAIGTTLLARAPQPRLAHWRIRHVDADGRSTVRVIRVLDVDGPKYALLAWCELHNAVRRFPLSSVQAVADLESGRAVDLARWWAVQQPAVAAPAAPAPAPAPAVAAARVRALSLVH